MSFLIPHRRMSKFSMLLLLVGCLATTSIFLMHHSTKGIALKSEEREDFDKSVFETKLLAQQTQSEPQVLPPQTSIRIVSVVCAEKGDHVPREKAALMIKSVIISTILYNVSSPVVFHLFLEHPEDEEYFYTKLEEYGDPFTQTRVEIYFHSVTKPFDREYHQNLLFGSKPRCTYLKLFFPQLLPHSDAILYLDTDVLVTGNIEGLWGYHSKMKDTQLIGAVPDIPTGSSLGANSKTPFPAPNGITTQVLLMNLTKMRLGRWTAKCTRIFGDYKRGKVQMSDQTIINVVLYYATDLLLQLPCNFNVWEGTCHKENYCSDVSLDPTGIQVVYTEGSAFRKRTPLSEIFTNYQKFNLQRNTTKGELQSDLVGSIKECYTLPTDNLTRWRQGKCRGYIGKHLFPTFVWTSNNNVRNQSEVFQNK